MKLKLSAVGNPDRGQPRNIGIKTEWVEVADLKQASEVCREFIRVNNLGSGNWTGGEVKGSSGETVAQISYNGRAWKAGKGIQEEVIL